MQEQDFLTLTDPLPLIQSWIDEACATAGLKEPRATAISTLSAEGELSTRIVLIKQVTSEGLIFYTNYNSRKGHDLAANPRCSGAMFWDSLARQIRFSGPVQKTSRAVSEAYWNSRKKESQLSQFISNQSETVDSRDQLERQWRDAQQRFDGKDIPCPAHWGGYLIQPNVVEFWIGQPGRLHDRFEYRLNGPSWTGRRLYP